MNNESSYPYKSSKFKVLKEMLQPERAVTLKPDELKLLITAAQKNDPVAKNRLYDGFVLLLFDLVKSDAVYEQLQEDALGIAWEEFFQLVNSYKGPDYARFPGLVRKVVSSRLYRAMQEQARKQSRLESYEQRTEMGIELPDEQDDIAAFLEHEEFRASLQQLSPQEQLLIYRTCILEISLSEQAVLQGCSTRTLQRQYKSALEKLRSNTDMTPPLPPS